MDNLPASPAILFPNVPDGFCPVGTWEQIFQQFIDSCLKNATLSVPGIGLVTPEEIIAINEQLTELQNQVTANQLYFRHGEFDLNNGDDVYTVAFDSTEPMPSADYAIHLTLVTTATGLVAPETVVSYRDGTQQVLGFGVNVDNGVTGQKVKWSVIGTA